MTDARYTEDHEWVRVEDGIATVGVTEHAQAQLGDVVYVDLPDPGAALEKGGEAGAIESVKAASEIYAPVSGEVVETNPTLADDPALVNRSAEDGGWFFRIRLSDPSELDSLMDAAAYAALIAD